MSARLAKGLFVLLAAWACVYFRRYYFELPDVVASHFNARGAANGWQSKQAFFGMFYGVTVLFGFMVLGLPTLIAKMPAGLIHLPNKEYWLAPEQRTATLEFMNAWLAWFGLGVYAVIVAAHHYAILSNLSGPKGLDPVRLWFPLACFGGFTIFWTIRLFIRFGRVPR